jgi:hypothetical protein
MSLNHLISGGKTDISIDVQSLSIQGQAVSPSTDIAPYAITLQSTAIIGDPVNFTSVSSGFASRTGDTVTFSGKATFTTNPTNTGDYIEITGTVVPPELHGNPFESSLVCSAAANNKILSGIGDFATPSTFTLRLGGNTLANQSWFLHYIGTYRVA